MRNDSILWGLGLVVIGGLLLADNLNLIPRGVNVWGIFWPLVLVLVGVRMLLGVTRGRSLPQEAYSLPLEGAESARVVIRYGAGELRIDDRAAPGELLTGSFGGGVERRVDRTGSQAAVELRLPASNFPVMGPFDVSSGLNWTIGFNPETLLSLDLEVGASRNLLDLRNLQVRDLRLQTGASATEIDFPAAAGQTRAALKSGAASVEARIPQGVAARIRTSGGLASIDVDTQRFPRIGDEYRSPDYDMADNRLDLDIETGLGSVNVR